MQSYRLPCSSNKLNYLMGINKHLMTQNYQASIYSVLYNIAFIRLRGINFSIR
jgi:hypothetical protein